MADISSSWADAEDELPAPIITSNSDGTKTVVSFRFADGKKVKITQRVKETVVRETVHPLVAQRRKWKKFGHEEGSAPGPDYSTTQLGEPVELRLGTAWREVEKQEEEAKLEESSKTGHNSITCRTCGGAHFTSKCPYKDTLGGDSASNGAAGSEVGTPEPETKSGYVPPHMRNRGKDGAPGISSIGGRFEDRDDSTTLKVTQLNEIVDEDMLRNELFKNFGPLQRVTIVKNRETGRSKGIAYVVFMSETRAQTALDALDGRGYHSLILHLEWSKPRPPKTV